MEVKTICPYCGTGCGLILEVVGGKLVKTRGWRDHPVSRGRVCIKGRAAHEFVQHSERLKHPLIKRNNKFVEVSWKEALRTVAENLRKFKEESGSDSIGVLSSAKGVNEENYLLQKFARIVLGTNNIDHCARLCHATSVGALFQSLGSGAMTNPIEDLQKADVILVIGSNTTETHPIIGMDILKAVKHGTKLIVIDPRKTKLAGFADVWLPLTPGTDIAVLNGMMNCIVQQSLIDLKFIKERTENFEAVKKSLCRFTSDYVGELAGLPPIDIIKAAEIYGMAKKASIIFAMGIAQHITGVDNVFALTNMALMTGNLGREGTGINPLRGQNNVQGAGDMGALPDYLPGYRKVTSRDDRLTLSAIWDIEHLPDNPMMTLTEMIKGTSEEISCMYIVGENPLLSHPDVNQTKKSLECLDFLIVQDIFLTETAQLANVVLPAATWAEKEGSFTNTERRVQRIRKAISPPGDAMPDWQIVCELASIMGYGRYFNFNTPKEIFEEIRTAVPIYSGITWNRLNNPEGVRWPCQNEKSPGTQILHVEKFTRGKGHFYPVKFKSAAETPDSEYPFILTTGRILEHFHTGSMSRRSSTLEHKAPSPYVEINLTDARNLRIRDADMVRLSSRRGMIELKAKVNDTCRNGVIFVPFHYREAAANVLTNPVLDPVTREPEYKVCAVKISKVEPQRRMGKETE